MRSTRREFIKTVVMSTGAVFVSWQDLLAAPFPAIPTTSGAPGMKRAHALLRDRGQMPRFGPTERYTDVAIIGGGMAGLAAAWRVKKARHDFVVLDSEPAAGGVMRYPVPVWHGIPFPVGATYFSQYTGEFKHFYRDLNVVPYETAEDAIYVARGEAVVDWWNPKVIESLPFPQRDRDAFAKFADTLLATQIPAYPLRQGYPDVIAKYDAISAKSWVDQFGSTALSAKLDSYSRSVLGAPLSEVNAYSFLNFYSMEFGMAFDIPCHTFAGGLGEITQRAQEFLGSQHLRSNTLVVGVENAPGGQVTVHCVDQASGNGSTITARAAIVATQKAIARHIVPGLPDVQVDAMKNVRYAPYVTIALCCNAPLFKDRAFDFWFNDPKNRFTDIIDVTSTVDIINGQAGRTVGDFVYMVSSSRPESERAALADPKAMAAFAQTVAQAVDEFVPGTIEKLEEMHVFSWGHSLVIPAVGSMKATYPMASQPHGQIFFANADNDLAPSVESAFLSGIDAADLALGARKP